MRAPLAWRTALSAVFASLSLVPHSALALQQDLSQATNAGPAALPDEYVAPGPLHRVLLPAGSPAIARLSASGAVLSSEDYGSFVQLYLDATRAGGVAGLRASGAQVVDEFTRVELNGFVLDAARPAETQQALDAQIPAALRAPQSAPAAGESRLRVVQFPGPIKDEWLDALRGTGASIVTYVPNNAYVVRTDALSDAKLLALRGTPVVLAIGSYEPAFKLRPELRGPSLIESAPYKVTVQVIADGQGEAFARGLWTRALAVLGEPNPVQGYFDVALEMDGANIQELALDSHVFAIEPLDTSVLLDERQGQIMAGNLISGGAQPSGPGYLAWLQGLGFPGQDPFPFSVDVTDDGIDRGSLSDVNSEFTVDGSGASRVAYVNNYSGDPLGDSVDGHGNINTSIIGGYNSLSGGGAADSLGYHYGLGVAPWVQLGDSKVFNNSGSGIFNQPTNVRLANAWNAGARISSNSWGYTSGTTYNSDAQLHDQCVRDAVSGTPGNQEMTIVFAAGNSGSGSSTVHPPGTAKNVITVGAGENWRMDGTDGCGIANSGADNANDIASFSSRGPTSDSRKKPEICAPGTHIEGAASRASGYNGSGVCNQYYPSGQTLYAWSSGTSHSTPAVSGACALLRQWYTNHGLAAPSPAMLKAEIVAGASYMTGAGANDTLWSNAQGFGRVDLGQVFDGAARIRYDETQVLAASGATWNINGNVSDSSKPFRVALAWTDVPGPTTGNAYVNNLDLEVTLNGTLYRGNVFSGATSVAGGTADTRNNLECVFLPAGTSGSFSITVRATNIAGDGVPGNADTTDQDFALLVYNGIEGAPAPDFSIAATPASQTITQGDVTNFNVSTAAQNGFSGNITLSATPAISGVSYSFSPNPVPAGASSTLNVTSTAGASVGTQLLSIGGTSGALVHTTGVSLTINQAGGGGNAVRSFSATPNLAIPDNNTTGVSSTIAVGDTLTISSLSVETVIPHPRQSDLVVTLTGPDGTSAILHNQNGGSAANVTTTFAIATTPSQTLSAFTGHGTAGNWVLKVQDLHAQRVGTFSSWKITFNGEQSVSPGLAIPDNDTTGITSVQNFTQTGTVASVKVRVNITHTYKGDLEVALIAPDGTLVLLHNRTGGSADNIMTEYPDLTAPNQSLAPFTGKTISGTWSLRVRDLAAQDVGTLNSWTLSFTAQ